MRDHKDYHVIRCSDIGVPVLAFNKFDLQVQAFPADDLSSQLERDPVLDKICLRLVFILLNLHRTLRNRNSSGTGPGLAHLQCVLDGSDCGVESEQCGGVALGIVAHRLQMAQFPEPAFRRQGGLLQHGPQSVARLAHIFDTRTDSVL